MPLREVWRYVFLDECGVTTDLRRVIERVDSQFRFLPPYGPDFNPR